jgi:hypothetical protein
MENQNNLKNIKGKKTFTNLIPAKKGEIRNKKGRGLGKKNFKTIFFEALNKIAEKNNTTAEAEYLAIVKKGIKMAQKGNYNFYKDTLDRVHGTALQNNANINVDNIKINKETKDKIDDLINSIL